VKPTKIIDIDYEAFPSFKMFNRSNRYNTLRPTVEQIEDREEVIEYEEKPDSVGGSSFISKIEETLFG